MAEKLKTKWKYKFIDTVTENSTFPTCCSCVNMTPQH